MNSSASIFLLYLCAKIKRLKDENIVEIYLASALRRRAETINSSAMLGYQRIRSGYVVA